MNNASSLDQDQALIANMADAYLKMQPDSLSSDQLGDVLTDGFAIVSSLLSLTTATTAYEEAKRKLAAKVVEKMHLIAFNANVTEKPASYPCFAC